tara:strand:- start:82 stop:282 length:201 start_codon:yes stop_codon:yes gene_type:complete
MKNRKVKTEGSAPEKTAKAVTYAEFKGQGRIPYGKTAPAPMASYTVTKKKSRGTGAAIKGTDYLSC